MVMRMVVGKPKIFATFVVFVFRRHLVFDFGGMESFRNIYVIGTEPLGVAIGDTGRIGRIDWGSRLEGTLIFFVWGKLSQLWRRYEFFGQLTGSLLIVAGKRQWKNY